VHGDGRIDQVAAQRPQPRENAILVRAREPAVADNIGDQDRSDLSVFGHGALTRHAIPQESSNRRQPVKSDWVKQAGESDGGVAAAALEKMELDPAVSPGSAAPTIDVGSAVSRSGGLCTYCNPPFSA